MNNIPVVFGVIYSFEETPVISEAELIFAVNADSCFKTEVDIEAIEKIKNVILAEKTDGEPRTGIGEKVEAVAESHASAYVKGNAEV